MKRYLILILIALTLGVNAQTTQDAKNYVNTNIVPNGNQEITGAKMNTALHKVIDANKFDSTDNKVYNSYADTVELNSNKVILSGYENFNINIPTYQLFKPTSISFENLAETVIEQPTCDGIQLVNLDSIKNINGIGYNITDTTSPSCMIYEFELNFDLSKINICENGYISQVILHNKNISVTNEEEMGLGLLINNSFVVDSNNNPLISGLNNYLVKTININTDTLTSIKAVFIWLSTNTIEMDGIELILKIGGCTNFYVVLTTDSNGVVKLDTLQGLITESNINNFLPQGESDGNGIYSGNGSLSQETNVDMQNNVLDFNNGVINLKNNGISGGLNINVENSGNSSNSEFNENGINVTTNRVGVTTGLNTGPFGGVNMYCSNNNSNTNFNLTPFDLGVNSLHQNNNRYWGIAFTDLGFNNANYIKKSLTDTVNHTTYDAAIHWENDTIIVLGSGTPSVGIMSYPTMLTISPNLVRLKTNKPTNIGDVLTLVNTDGEVEFTTNLAPSIFGQATLTAGTVTVSNTNIQSTSIIICTANGVLNSGFVSVTKNAGVGFTIQSSNILDGRTVDYMIKY